jgi:OmpA-OmpF porin, OOP family
MMKRTTTRTLLTLLCLGLSQMTWADNRALTPADLERIEKLQRRVDKLAFGALGSEHYGLSKARAWLDLALDEYHEKDRTGIVQDATAEAAALLDAMDGDPAFDARSMPELYASEKVRPDLWEQVEAMKQHPEFACAGRRIAELEVQLVWTGHEKWESGWSHAEPYAGVAENLAYEAEQKIARCSEARKPSLADVPASVPAVTITVEKFTLSSDALFRFGQAGVEQMAAGGQPRLAALVAGLKDWKSIEKIEIVGHTDHLGMDDYNQELSRQRAEQVRLYLAGHGIPAELIQTRGLGEAQPLVECGIQPDRRALIECLQPNRRVVITILGVR